jgi:hypothetical protein
LSKSQLEKVNAWIPVAAQTVLGLLTIVGSGVVVHRLNARKDQREFMRSKLEALFFALAQTDEVFSRATSCWYPVFLGGMSYEEAVAAFQEATKVGMDQSSTMEMLVNLYFPELLQELQRQKSAVIQIATVQGQVIKAAQFLEKDLSRFLEPYRESIKRFDDATEEFKKSIFRCGAKLKLVGERASNGTPGR